MAVSGRTPALRSSGLAMQRVGSPRSIMQHPTFLAVVVAIVALSGAAEAVQTDLDGLVVDGCNATIATAIADSDDYDDCYKQSGFTFDLSLSSTTDEDDFCTSRECLSVFRALRKQKVLECAIVDGLEEVPLTEGAGQIACFGVPAVTTNSTVIIRPPKGSASGSSGSGSQTPEPTTTPPTITPTTDTPEPTTPKPTTTKPGSDSGSGSRSSDPIVSPSPIASSSSSMDTTTIVTIAGICVGVLVVLATLWCAAVRTKKKKKKKKKKNRRSKHMRPTEADYYGSDHQPTAAQYYASASPTVRLSQQHRGTRGTASHMTWQTGAAGVSSAFAGWDEELIAAVRIPYEKLSFDQLISRGGYGEVYRGRYRGQVVAIKTLLPERRRDMRQIQRFLSEVKMMATMEHDRIVRLIGVAWDSLEELSVVTEFLERGDLRTVLNEFETRQHRPHGYDVDKIRIAMHVAHALTYLHSLQPVVLHRDLKSRNILLDTKLNAKLADFGVSREREDRTMTAGVGSSLWMAPEVMIGERYDEKADVFSFGVVLSELDQHVLPYSHAVEPGTGRKLPDPVVLQMVSLGRIRVAFTDEEQSEMAHVALQCVALNPADRPTAAQALHLIHQAWRRC